MPDPTVQLYELDGYIFDRRTGNFHGPLPSTAVVARAKVMRLIQERIGYHDGQLANITRALNNDLITLAQWERAFAQELKDLYLQQAALARGGWQNMTQADFGRVGQQLREQYRYLHGFAQDIAAGKLSPAQIAARAAMYASSGRAAYWAAMTGTMMRAGMTRERRLAKGDRGSCSPCVDLARKGWQPIGALPAPGGPPCAGLSRCRCEKEYT